MKHLFTSDKGNVRAKALGLLLSLTLVISGTTNAQEATYVEITGGNILINGEVLPVSKYPESFDPSGMNASFSFFGDTNPIIEIKRHYFVVVKNGLIDAVESDLTSERANIYLTSDDLHQERIRDAYSKELSTLREKAQDLDDYRVSDRAMRKEDVAQLVEDAQQSAEQVVVIASQMPRSEMDGYWNVVKKQNVELYNRFNREWTMEQQAQEMALKARSLQDGKEKKDLINELRSTIEQIYVLKQENRKREIVQLQLQLEGLEGNMKSREEFKDQIIEQRLRDLLGFSRQ